MQLTIAAANKATEKCLASAVMADCYKVMNTNSQHDLWDLIQKSRERELGLRGLVVSKAMCGMMEMMEKT